MKAAKNATLQTVASYCHSTKRGKAQLLAGGGVSSSFSSGVISASIWAARCAFLSASMMWKSFCTVSGTPLPVAPERRSGVCLQAFLSSAAFSLISDYFYAHLLATALSVYSTNDAVADGVNWTIPRRFIDVLRVEVLTTLAAHEQPPDGRETGSAMMRAPERETPSVRTTAQAPSPFIIPNDPKRPENGPLTAFSWSVDRPAVSGTAPASAPAS